MFNTSNESTFKFLETKLVISCLGSGNLWWWLLIMAWWPGSLNLAQIIFPAVLQEIKAKRSKERTDTILFMLRQKELLKWTTKLEKSYLYQYIMKSFHVHREIIYFMSIINIVNWERMTYCGVDSCWVNTCGLIHSLNHCQSQKLHFQRDWIMSYKL